MTPGFVSQSKQAVLLIADISGYSEFIIMKKVSAIHAEEIITELLEAISEAASFPLKLNKIEGDALFFCADAKNNVPEAVNDVSRQAAKLMTAFRQKQEFLVEHGDGGCPCSACRSVGELGLKILIHTDQVILKSIAGRQELAGTGVILIHRLLKNSILENDYILFPLSTACLLDHLPMPNKRQLTENVADFGPVEVVAFLSNNTAKPKPAKRPFTSISGIKEALRLFSRHYKRKDNHGR